MLLNIVLLITALAAAAYLAFSRQLRGSDSYRALLTPLASIMGSGFLVSAPLLSHIAGSLAVFCMAGLLVLAYAVGGVIRFNIRHFEPVEHLKHGAPQRVAAVSRVVLAAAYFVSVSYYLQLLAVFSLSYWGIENTFYAHCITTTLLLVIGGVGILRGLDALERVEKYAVSLNLGVICALLGGLLWHNGKLLTDGTWQLPEVSSHIDLHDVRLLLGLLIVVQGFETSRFLGDEHRAEVRIKTMRWAQLLSGLIYLCFIALCTVLFSAEVGTDVSGITQMILPVAAVLPLMVTIAAIGSQFSAAVADDAGAGGLIEDLANGRLSLKHAYGLILVVTVALTWVSNVNQIISYASRAFALFYVLQCAVAALLAFKMHGHRRRIQAVVFSCVGLLCLCVVVFGISSE